MLLLYAFMVCFHPFVGFYGLYLCLVALYMLFCHALLQVLSLLCPSRILFLDAYLLCALIECLTCKWYFTFKLISLLVRMFIPYVNEHYGHYFIVIACMAKPWLVALFHFAWSHCACFICITIFSAYNDQIVLLCFRRYLFLWLKSFTNSRVRCEWVLFNCFQLTC